MTEKEDKNEDSVEFFLKDVSIHDLFFGKSHVYEIPIYQRNYAWEKEEIETLVQDVWDACKKGGNYYIGSLVSYKRDANVFEIIDGQQRLTTINILLIALGFGEREHLNILTYRARKRSDDTIKALAKIRDTIVGNNRSAKTLNSDSAGYDVGIVKGLRFALDAVTEIVDGDRSNKDDKDRNDSRTKFKDFLIDNVRIIHYKVPRDIDLNHYFEIMNSRGEQLEKHEIAKAQLIECLGQDKTSCNLFNMIWESCSQMSLYIQQCFDLRFRYTIFGKTLSQFLPERDDGQKEEEFLFSLNFEANQNETGGCGNGINVEKSASDQNPRMSLADLLKKNEVRDTSKKNGGTDPNDAFQPIIDFPNFLLVVLKYTRLELNELTFENDSEGRVVLDDKNLLDAFDCFLKAGGDKAGRVKRFACNLLKARFFLDNFVVHHLPLNDNNPEEQNPWALQVYKRIETGTTRSKGQPKYDYGPKKIAHSESLIQLLSMFEVSYSSRQRKNYLFYCICYLMKNWSNSWESNIEEGTKSFVGEYAFFVENLADRFFSEVYLRGKSFDDAMLTRNDQGLELITLRPDPFMTEHEFMTAFYARYGDGKHKIDDPESFGPSSGIPLYVFSYLDYRIWKLYADNISGKNLDSQNTRRKHFFEELGCGDNGLDIFSKFYFSRTRKSLEHFYPQAKAVPDKEKTTDSAVLSQTEINCLGNYAMISGEANSSGSDWDPSNKVDRYLDQRKVEQVGVASLKFKVMLQVCKDQKDQKKWEKAEIQKHQEKMLNILWTHLSEERKAE